MNARALGIALLAAAFATALACIGCTPRAPQRTAVEFWQPFEASRYDSVIARFERANPTLTVRVHVIAPGAMRDSIAAALASGALPDLCVLDSTAMPALLEHGDLSDWSAGVADLRDSLAGWELCSVGDALYGMPWLLETHLLYIDRDALARAKVDPSVAFESWESIERFATQWKQRRGSPGWALPTNDLYPVATAAQLSVFDPVAAADTAAGSEDRRPMVSGVQLLARLRPYCLAANQDSIESAFLSGKLPCCIASSRAMPRFLDARKSGVEARVLPPPTGPSTKRYLVGSGLCLASFNRSLHKEAALRFARSLVTTPREDQPVSPSHGWAPSSRSGASSSGVDAALARTWFEPREPMNLDGGPQSAARRSEDWQRRRRAYEQVFHDVIFLGRPARASVDSVCAEEDQC